VLRFLADHSFNFHIVSGVRRRAAGEGIPVDIVTAFEVGLARASDPELLQWAAGEGRLVLTEDVNTLVGFAYDRVSAGQPMPGVFAMVHDAPVATIISDVLLLSEASDADEWRDRVWFLPL